jgi:hypothetical protein
MWRHNPDPYKAELDYLDLADLYGKATLPPIKWWERLLTWLFS